MSIEELNGYQQQCVHAILIVSVAITIVTDSERLVTTLI